MTSATYSRALLALFILSSACASRATRITLPDVASDGCPTILLTRSGGLGFESQTGVLAAVWPSGEILRAESTALLGPNHFVGMLSPTDLATLTELAQSPETRNQPHGQTVLDSPDDILTLRSGDDVRQWKETPGFTSTPTVSEFRSKLFSVPVTDARAIDDQLNAVMQCAATKTE